MEILMHSPYNPDIAPLDYHLFRSLQNSLDSVKLTSKEACENHRSFSPKNHRSSTVIRLWFYFKNAEDDRTKHIWFNKLYLKYEKKLVSLLH